MDTQTFIFFFNLAIFLMMILVALSGATVGYHSSRTKMTRTEHEAIVTAVIAGLLCDVLAHFVAKAMHRKLRDHFDILAMCILLGVFLIGGLLGAWWRTRSTSQSS